MFNKYNLPGMLWAMFIMLLCGLPGNRLPSVHFWSFLPVDKIVHFSLYTIFIFLLVRGFKTKPVYTTLKGEVGEENIQQLSILQRKPLTIAILIGILYGIFIEFLQATVFIQRGAEFKDVVANTAGCFFGAYLVNVYLKGKAR